MSEPSKTIKTPYASGIGSKPLTEHDCGDAAPGAGIHLYHFPPSSCSRKVRMALEYKGVSVQYHPVLLPLGDQHLPQYVRINPRCVVPSLVVDKKVTTDSKNIIDHLDTIFPDASNKLIPEDEEERKLCQHWTQIADEVPIHAITFGEIKGVQKPFLLQQLTKGSDEKVCAQLESYIEQHKDDPYLKKAYEDKLKVVQANNNIRSKPTNMEAVVESVEKTLVELNEQLANGPFSKSSGFLCSVNLSTADIEWCVLLNRFVEVGAGARWVDNPEKLPHIRPYLDKLVSLQCYKDGIASFDSKLSLLSLVVSRKLKGALGYEVVL